MEKKCPIGGYAPGNYQCHCATCGGGFIGDKRAYQCEPCALNDRAKFDALSPMEQKELRKRNAEAIKTIIGHGEPKYYPGAEYQNLFDYLTKEHGLTLLDSEMNDLIEVVHKFHPAGAASEKPYDELYRLAYSTLAKLRARTREDRILNYASSIRGLIEEVAKQMLVMPQPNNNEPPFLVQSDESPAAAKEEVDPQELWDEHSALIGDDIDDLSFWAGREVMKKEDFFKALKQQKNP